MILIIMQKLMKMQSLPGFETGCEGPEDGILYSFIAPMGKMCYTETQMIFMGVNAVWKGRNF